LITLLLDSQVVIFPSSSAKLLTMSDEICPEDLRLLRNAGIDPHGLSKTQLRNFNKTSDKAKSFSIEIYEQDLASYDPNNTFTEGRALSSKIGLVLRLHLLTLDQCKLPLSPFLLPSYSLSQPRKQLQAPTLSLSHSKEELFRPQ